MPLLKLENRILSCQAYKQPTFRAEALWMASWSVKFSGFAPSLSLSLSLSSSLKKNVLLGIVYQVSSTIKANG
jgi:hypothetical protein